MNIKKKPGGHSGKGNTMTERANQYRILLAEDDYEMRTLLAVSLRRSGYDVIECSDGIGLLTHLETFFLPDGFEREAVDLIISDIRMPGITGMEVLEGKPKYRDFPPMIVITAFGDAETHEMAYRCGAAAVFDKPFDVDLLLEKVKDVFEDIHAEDGR